MKNLFSKVKSGISKVLTNIKNVFSKLKNKLRNIFTKTKNKGNEEFVNFETNEGATGFEKDIKNVSKQMESDKSVPINKDVRFKTTESDAFVASTIVDKPKRNDDIEIKKDLNQDNLLYQKEIESVINNKSTEKKEEYEKIISIEIKEDIGVVNFETITGKKYQKNIEDILDEKRNLYKNWNINKKCNDFAKNKIQAIRLKRNLNPIVISTLNNEEDIDNYIKCVNNTEKIWFNLEHDLINSRLKGKNARLMKRVGKYEEEIGAKVKKKEGLIERMLKKIKTIGNKPEKMVDEIETIEKDNNDFSKIEEEIKTDINNMEDKKYKKEKRLSKKEKEKADKKEFKERYASYATLIGKLYDLRPRKKLDDIMSDIIDRDIYNLTDKDAWTRAVATYNVGDRLSLTNPKEAKIYLMSAYDQLKNEELLSGNGEAFQYLEDTLLNLQEIYIRQNNFIEAHRLNEEYMKVVEREKNEILNPMLSEYKKDNSQIKEIDLMSEYRKRYVAGQKVEMKLLNKVGLTFDAEELYRKILNESGIVLTDEAYDLSIKENCIENGKYIVISNGVTYREPILGNERYLFLKNKLTQQLIDNKKGGKIAKQPTTQPKATESMIEPTTQAKATESIVESTIQPKKTELKENEVEEKDAKKKGIILRAREAIDNKTKEIVEKSKERKAKEELIKKQKEEQKKIEEEKRKKLEEERRKVAEEKRKLEEQKKAENAEFNKRYNDYNVLVKGMLGVPAKRNIQDIRNDVVHNDIYNMTSGDEVTKGIATFRVGHKLATLSTKKKEAERLLKTAISILNKDDILSKDDTLIGTLEDAHLDLGNLYLAKNDFVNAEKSFVDYMETVRKEKIEKYDPKILAAKKNGKVINEIDLWMEVKSKFTTGKKSMIRLLSKSGKTDEAEELYKRLLEDCKISLSDEEYQLSVDSNCIENGRYMRITSGKTYSEPILGNEYLLLRRKNISKKAVEEMEK